MNTNIYLTEDDDPVEIRRDSVFKAVFTKDMPESRIALSRLVSDLIGREVTIDVILANEIPVNSLHDRQVRFDINCRARNGEKINVEMCFNPEPFEPVRLEYHTCKLFTAQNIKGKDKNFNNLLRVYQITILAKKRYFPDNDCYHAFEYYDPANKVSLNGRTKIITLELSKLKNAAFKAPENMDIREKWAYYFRYLTDRGRRNIINSILENEEGIAMASKVVMSISRDEEERMRLYSQEKAELDYQSKMVSAKRTGKRIGMREGMREGIREGMREGERIGELKEYQRLKKLAESGKSLEEIFSGDNK